MPSAMVPETVMSSESEEESEDNSTHISRLASRRSPSPWHAPKAFRNTNEHDSDVESESGDDLEVEVEDKVAEKFEQASLWRQQEQLERRSENELRSHSRLHLDDDSKELLDVDLRGGMGEDVAHDLEGISQKGMMPKASVNPHSTEDLGAEHLSNGQGDAPWRSTTFSETLSLFTFPKSLYSGYVPPLPVCAERVAIDELVKETESTPSDTDGSSDTGQDFEEIDLSEFSVYLPKDFHRLPYHFRGLHYLNSQRAHSTLIFDGILSVGKTSRYVQGVEFDICSIGNYGEEHQNVDSTIWIRSKLNANSEIYYRLRAPSKEYAPYYEGFLWLANFAKHFVDYCHASQSPVSINDFRTKFSEWLKRKHSKSANFSAWYEKNGRDDFRHSVCRNIDFLHKEAMGVFDSDPKLYKQIPHHPVWRQIQSMDSITEYPIREQKTVVTPYVYDCFSHIRFGKHLKSVEPIKVVESKQASLVKKLDLTSSKQQKITSSKPNSVNAADPVSAAIASEVPVTLDNSFQREQRIKAIKIGDVLAVPKDDIGSVWKDEVSRWKAQDESWLVLVQGIHEKKGKKFFDFLWIYRPSDTSCAKMKYPFPNELFISNNCSCSTDRIDAEEVLDVVQVTWFGHPISTSTDPFVRQAYIDNERFVSLKEEHKTCEHLRGRSEPRSVPSAQFPIGHTVLAQPPRFQPKYDLEVYEVVDYITNDSRELVVLRHLQRRSVVDGGRGQPNELVYSDHQIKVSPNKIHSACLVRFYGAATKCIPAPYNRNGAGNIFFITTRLIQKDDMRVLIPIEEDYPRSLVQGFDPLCSSALKPLRGMDLYCGGGNFGRGLEEGHAVENLWAVDISQVAIHTYAANLNDPNGANLFFGSVDDLLKAAMNGNPQNLASIPLPGEVDFISAGSPCQGFSLLNSHRDSDKGLKNQSLVASVAAYVDFYRPQYGLLENVMNMAQKGVGRDEDILSQLIACIVGMGYQTQLFVLDSWSSGCPQSRSRLFISFAAPNLEPLPHPALSHSHPPNVTDRGLGMLANGEAFGRRVHTLTPFNFITSSESTKDLPAIGDGLTYHCIPFPDHIMPNSIGPREKRQINSIPRYPRGSSFLSAWDEGRGRMSKLERENFPTVAKDGTLRYSVIKGSRAWSRAHPDKLFNTITSGLRIADSKNAGSIHWNEHRILTIMEARRAQAFPDDEILVGSRAAIWKILGNSVARTVSTSLGLALREAWLKNELNSKNRGSSAPPGPPSRLGHHIAPELDRDGGGQQSLIQGVEMSVTVAAERQATSQEDELSDSKCKHAKETNMQSFEAIHVNGSGKFINAGVGLASKRPGDSSPLLSSRRYKRRRISSSDSSTPKTLSRESTSSRDVAQHVFLPKSPTNGKPILAINHSSTPEKEEPGTLPHALKAINPPSREAQGEAARRASTNSTRTSSISVVLPRLSQSTFQPPRSDERPNRSITGGLNRDRVNGIANMQSSSTVARNNLQSTTRVNSRPAPSKHGHESSLQPRTSAPEHKPSRHATTGNNTLPRVSRSHSQVDNVSRISHPKASPELTRNNKGRFNKTH